MQKLYRIQRENIMAEQEERTYIPYTYTYDQFTAFFHSDRVYLSEKNYAIGQCCVDIMNMDETVLDEIDRRVEEFVPAAWALLPKKTNSAPASAQKKLNAVWDLIFAMPVYRELNMDLEVSYHAIERLYADKAKWEQVKKSHSEEREIYRGMISELESFTGKVRLLRRQIGIMAEQYFEPLKRRNSKAYGEAYADFYSDMFRVSAGVFQEDFKQSIPIEVSFVPMMQQDDTSELFVAEKATFRCLTDFLRTEFYRGLAMGNAPRRCHNCGTYFLLTKGYNTCYCNNIAPGETERTCRKVGAHRKEAQGKANRSPVRIEYDRTYNRLKQKKNRKKISVDEWNAAVAEAMKILEMSERGELTDDEMKARFETF